jgi:hypothetical protein
MDPYLEHPTLWPDVHNSLIAALRDDLSPRLAPRYYVGLQNRTYSVKAGDLELVGFPDDSIAAQQPLASPSPLPLAALDVVEVQVPVRAEVSEFFLEVHLVNPKQLVTIIEVLSPTNKIGKGRDEYEAKREQIFESRTNLVEIDLLRAGDPLPVSKPIASDYRLLVSRGSRRPYAQLYPFSVRQPIPTFELPLLPGDNEALVDLNALWHTLYTHARFDLLLDYGRPPVPPLPEADADWAWNVIQRAR